MGTWDNAKWTWKTTKTDTPNGTALCAKQNAGLQPSSSTCEQCHYNHEEEQNPQS